MKRVLVKAKFRLRGKDEQLEGRLNSAFQCMLLKTPFGVSDQGIEDCHVDFVQSFTVDVEDAATVREIMGVVAHVMRKSCAESPITFKVCALIVFPDASGIPEGALTLSKPARSKKKALAADGALTTP